jgi:glycerol-3-phosphate dehydrogenase
LSGISAFSALNREKTISTITQKKFDVLVIGGGITGAGIALDAISRGLSVALVEKQDFSQGTSSRSTKLIHGGLRYLKQLEFGLVKEVGQERAILYKNAPHLVIPEKMLLPIIKKGSLGYFSSYIGLGIYDWLAGVQSSERRQMFSKRKTVALEPLLKKETLKGGALYIEYRTDDARLVIETLKTAVSRGAVCINYIEALEFIYENRKAIGITAVDKLQAQQMEIKAKKIINASGPWVDALRTKDKSIKKKRLHLTKGVHIVVPYKRFPLHQSVYFDVRGGRMIFAIPRGKSTYIGTTDTDYKGDIDQPNVTQVDKEYLLTAVNELFPSVKLTDADITSSWSGLRPLIHQEGKSPSELSRKDEIFISNSGVIAIAGGKLTGYRKMAERIVDLVCKQLEKEEKLPCKHCITDSIVLCGGDFSSPEEIPFFIERMAKEAKMLGAELDQINALAYKYGTQTEKIIEKARSIHTERKLTDPYQILLLAEIWYGIQYEMVNTLNDFLIRRTGRLYFERTSLEKVYPVVLKEMADLLGWNEEQKQNNVNEFHKEYIAAVSFQ